jgi:hypothetical protein
MGNTCFMSTGNKLNYFTFYSCTMSKCCSAFN